MDPILNQFRPQMQVLNRPTRQAVRVIARAYRECRAMGMPAEPEAFISDLWHAEDEGDRLQAEDVLRQYMEAHG